MNVSAAKPVAERPRTAAPMKAPKSTSDGLVWNIRKVRATLSGVAMEAPHAHESNTASRAASPIKTSFFETAARAFALRSSPPIGSPVLGSLGHPLNYGCRLVRAISRGTSNVLHGLGTHLGFANIDFECSARQPLWRVCFRYVWQFGRRQVGPVSDRINILNAAQNGDNINQGYSFGGKQQRRKRQIRACSKNTECESFRK